tara:strand:+ start:1070 stop:1504 length:435 start_codon:yes stop_codon:yes gene_type:complete
MAAGSKVVKGIFGRTLKQTAAERAKAATGKKINRTGGRTSATSAIAGKDKTELQVIIRNLKDKEKLTATEKTQLVAAEKRLATLTTKDATEVDKIGRASAQSNRDRAEFKGYKPSSPFSMGGMPNKRTGNIDMRKGGMFKTKGN